jgi:hypothetical protein
MSIDFKEYKELKILNELCKNSLNESINKSDFIQGVSKYSSLDDALMNLPDEYTEFYFKHINDKKLEKTLKKLKLVENINEVTDVLTYDVTVGTSPQDQKFKRIHYKGEYIVIKYDERFGWIPSISFRSIPKALKYIKKVFDAHVE